MTNGDKKELKGLIKEGTIEALKSSEGQDAIVGAMRSEGGQASIIDAMNSIDGQDAIKRGSLAALKSEEGQSILVNNFVESFHKAVVPSLDSMTNSINGLNADVARIKESAVRREELTEIIKRKMKGLSA